MCLTIAENQPSINELPEFFYKIVEINGDKFVSMYVGFIETQIVTNSGIVYDKIERFTYNKGLNESSRKSAEITEYEKIENVISDGFHLYTNIEIASRSLRLMDCPKHKLELWEASVNPKDIVAFGNEYQVVATRFTYLRQINA